MSLRLFAFLLLGNPLLLPAQGVPALQRLATIGCADCGGPAQFAEIADVAVTPSGQVWMADRDDPRIRAFSPRGAFIRSFGRRGQGPGEYAVIGKILPSADGTLAIIDIRLFRLSRVDSLGRVRSTMTLTSFPFDAAAAPGSSTVYLLFSRFQPGTSSVARTAAGSDSVVPVLGPLRDFPSREVPSELHSLAVAPDGSLAVGDGGSEYRIRVYRGGRASDITRKVSRKVRTPAEMTAMQSLVNAGGRKAQAEGGRPTREVPREKFHFSWMGLQYDQGGRLWVRTGRGDETRTVFDLFAPSGAWLGEVALPGEISRFSLGGNYLATAAVDADGVPRVTIWTIADR